MYFFAFTLFFLDISGSDKQPSFVLFRSQFQFFKFRTPEWRPWRTTVGWRASASSWAGVRRPAGRSGASHRSRICEERLSFDLIIFTHAIKSTDFSQWDFTQPHSPALEAGSRGLLHEGAPLVEVAPDFTASDLRGHVHGLGLLALVVAAAEQPRRQPSLGAGRDLLRI